MNIPGTKTVINNDALHKCIHVLQNKKVYNNQWMTPELLIKLLKLPFDIRETVLNPKMNKIYPGIDQLCSQHIIARRWKKVKGCRTYGYLLKHSTNDKSYDDGNWYKFQVAL